MQSLFIKYSQMKNELLEQFIALVKIPSPSGYEKEVRTYLKNKLSKSSWITKTDGSGNLMAYKSRTAKLWLVAHMDTVLQNGQKVTPLIKNDIVYSDGTTILGADNKVGVAILLDLAVSSNLLDKCGLIFTVNEEEGEMGSARIDWNNFSPELILNIDGCEEVGIINDCGMGQIVFEIDVYGKSAHAAKHPDLGINAIEVACHIVNKIQQGADDEGNTCNIGKIDGGIATNVVADHVKIVGEMRSFNKITLSSKWKMLNSLVMSESEKYGAKCVVTKKKAHGVPVWEQATESKYKHLLLSSASSVGIKAKFEKMFACSDANYLSKTAHVFSINHGGSNPHTVMESIKINDILSANLFISSIVSSFNQSL